MLRFLQPHRHFSFNSRLVPLEKHWVDVRLDRVLQKKLKIPWSLTQKLTRKNSVKILQGDKYLKVDVNYKIKDGDILCVHDKSALNEEPVRGEKESRLKLTAEKPVDSRLIVYEDANMIVINKPCGLPSQGGVN
jgi:23S rRNA-/tRNA-specific pseudouridylate synthase